ncbi:ABC transporter transmembrane domain-containing protein [uncultured Methanobrevibacter sp.]|uniref:ABC transporter transmembrane domain-containing protein n=1 Tax=uncultured Methanobrevibacter sp. TaxID=253161 RepID=UPI002635DB8C|nr:ABC transporter transmembrane domain-containing protein [uncultured Methanobrevibacter sp.]
MKKFLKFALKPQWKTISVIFVLVILQTVFQIEIINQFSSALMDLKSQEINLLFDDAALMLILTVLSMISIYATSVLATKVSSKVAHDTREKIFHILMNLPDEEINKFKITGLITRSTRGIYSEQGFLIIILKQFIVIPFVFIAIVVEIALIDMTFAALFATVILILTAIIILRLKQLTQIYFKAKKTYGKINQLFFNKISNIANGIPFKRQEAHCEFEKACEDSYNKNITYLLSQYYLGPILLLVLDVLIVVLLTMMNFGYSIGFEAENIIDSVVIIQYILYFMTTLVIVPTMIERWPRSYATSVRLEEVLNLEDKVIENEKASKRIEIIEKDIENDYKNTLVDRKEIARKFNMVLSHYRIHVIISMVLLTISTLCIVYAPKVAGNIVNMFLFDSDSPNTILANIGLLFTLYSVGYLLKLPSNRFMAFVSEKIAYNLRMELFDNLETIGQTFIQKNSKGHVLSRLNNDLMNIREFISMHISEIIAQFLSILFVIVLILTTDWKLSLIYLITLPIYFICFYYSDIKSKTLYENHKKNLGIMMSYFERSLTNRSKFHEKGFEKINETVTDHYIKSRNISNAVFPITTLLTNLSNISVYIIGFYFLVTNEIQLGTLLTVIIYGQLLTKPLKKVSTSLISLETSFSSMKRIFGIIEFEKFK